MQDSGDYAALPAMGEPVTAGVIYNDSGNLVVARQTHNRTEHDVSTIPALFAVWRTGASGDLDWVDQEQVEVGMRRVFDGVLYECLQAHQTQSDWTPPAVPALWKVVVTETPTDDWTPGVTYAVDDVVMYNEQEWRCAQAHTALAHWYPGAPGVYLWELVE